MLIDLKDRGMFNFEKNNLINKITWNNNGVFDIDTTLLYVPSNSEIDYIGSIISKVLLMQFCTKLNIFYNNNLCMIEVTVLNSSDKTQFVYSVKK